MIIGATETWEKDSEFELILEIKSESLWSSFWMLKHSLALHWNTVKSLALLT